MIISCTNCKKKFELEDNLIPDTGRLLQCSSCSHKWFFKKELLILPETSKKKIDPKDKNESFLKTEIPNEVERIIKYVNLVPFKANLTSSKFCKFPTIIFLTPNFERKDLELFEAVKTLYGYFSIIGNFSS